jgi:hypothetical protein
LPTLRQWKIFADGVSDELLKAGINHPEISNLQKAFVEMYGAESVKKYGSLQSTIQGIKDAYFTLMDDSATRMTERYTIIITEAEALINEIGTCPEGLNDKALTTANAILAYAEKRIIAGIEIDWDVKDKMSRFTFSEMLSFIELQPAKMNELLIARSSLIRVKPKKDEPKSKTRVIPTTLPSKSMSVSSYRGWLSAELSRLASASNDDIVEINIESGE